MQHQEVERAQATQMEGGVPCQGMLVEGVPHLEEGVEEEDHHQEGAGEEVGHHPGMVVEAVVVGHHQGVAVAVEVGVVLHHLVGVGEGADHLKNKNIMNLNF